jgi:tRNA A-37 threonylcarbamoyl transferase component Bud32
LADGSENQFGKYELQARIAAGGMAEIFKARFAPAPGVSKQVVIKRILSHYAANQAFISMFTNEAKIAIGLSHGNIAQVFDFGEIDGDWFLAMELVDGQPLSKVMKRARTMQIAVMPTPFAVLIGIEMLKGLHYAHTRLDEQGRPLQIVHRDVSPQNILISYEGHVKIVDFGIAKARNAGQDETQAGAVKGKYSYFAPEQARGKELDARTDVFAAGIVLYEMLCGQLPFQGKMIEVLSKIVRGDFPRPTELNPAIPPELEKIMLKAMSVEKADRYQTGEDFQQALSAYLNQIAPTFAASRLGLFMGLLFEEELVGEGRPVQLPREFLDQVGQWKVAMPAAPVPLEQALPPTRKSRPMPIVTDEIEEPPTGAHFSAPRWIRPTLFTAIPLAAALLTGLGVFAWGKWSTFSVRISSEPTAAMVRVDGKAETQITPLVLADLSAADSHEIEISAPGMKPWVRIVHPQRGAVLSMHAELELDRLPDSLLEEPDAGIEEPVVAALPPRVIEVQADYPVASFKLEAKKHAFLVPPSKAARLRLDPKKTYKVWTEGGQCVFFLEGAPARESFGLVGPKPGAVKGATALYAFIADASPPDPSIKVRVMDTVAKTTSSVLVEAKSNAFVPDPSERFTLNRLDPKTSYELKLKDGHPSARTGGEKGGPARRLLVGIGIRPNRKPPSDGQRVLEMGKPLRVGGAAAVWFSFPDDRLDDNEGALEVEVSAK